MTGIGEVIDSRKYGPYQAENGDRTIVILEVRRRENGNVYASFVGEMYEADKYGKRGWYSFGQEQGSAPAELKALWDRWHLNDMRSACVHQRSRGETWDTHPQAVCPDCGYRLGSTWLYEPLPENFLTLCDNAA